jgi:hypothetical protein
MTGMQWAPIAPEKPRQQSGRAWIGGLPAAYLSGAVPAVQPGGGC